MTYSEKLIEFIDLLKPFFDNSEQCSLIFMKYCNTFNKMDTYHWALTEISKNNTDPTSAADFATRVLSMYQEKSEECE